MTFYNKGFYDKFARIFPPPRFLEMQASGIDISDNVIRYLGFKPKNIGLELNFFGEKELPDGAIVGGHINKPQIVSSILREISKDLPTKFVRVSLPEEKAYLFQTQIPKIEGADPYESVGYKLEENVPISPEEALYDFTILPQKKLDSDHFDAVVVVIPKQVSELYESVMSQAGLFPLAFEIGSQSIARAVTNKKDDDVKLIINFNETKTGFSLVASGVVRFTSTVSIGARDTDKKIADILQVPMSEVVKIKERVAMTGNLDMEAFFKLMSTLSPIEEELSKLESYWQTHGADKAGLSKDISEIILTGRDTAIPPVLEYIEAMTGIKTSVASVWDNVLSLEKTIPDLSFYKSLDYAGAIGLAMGKDSNV